MVGTVPYIIEVAFVKKSDKFAYTISDNLRRSYMIFVACVGKCFNGNYEVSFFILQRQLRLKKIIITEVIQKAVFRIHDI
jgi:hypothetical protein